MVIWYIFPVWVCCIQKNLATLMPAIDFVQGPTDFFSPAEADVELIMSAWY
jgi:hypothetical protein